MKMTHRNDKTSFSPLFIYAYVCLLFALIAGGCSSCESREIKPVPPHPFIGAGVSDVAPELASPLGLPSDHGAVIVSVLAGGPADTAGLKVNDILLRWNKEAIPSAAALQWMVIASQAGGQAEVEFVRQGKGQTTQITLRERTAGESAARTQADIERDFLQTDAQVKRGEAKPAEVFGDTDKWMLNIGPHRLFLDPISKQWLYYDTLHGTWESSGFGIGEANFALFGGQLAAKRVVVMKSLGIE